mgnify:FL=1|tara:strand:+ start:1820 stop:2071 length:252 start_codon:yes stop_codon:yes gene_type:complete
MKKLQLFEYLSSLKKYEIESYHEELLYISECLRDKKPYMGMNERTLMSLLESFISIHPSQQKKEDIQDSRIIRKVIREIIKNK